MLRNIPIQIVAVCGLSMILAGCGTGEYEQRLQANLNSLGVKAGNDAGGDLAAYQEIPFYPDWYEIRLPADYSAAVVVEEKPNLRVRWTGAQRSNQTEPELEVRIFELQPGTTAPALDEAMTQQIETLRDSFDDVKPSATQSISLGGIDFLRVGWSGTDKKTSLPVQGFLYVAVDTVMIIHIQWHDGFDEANETMDAAYASADSFRPTS